MGTALGTGPGSFAVWIFDERLGPVPGLSNIGEKSSNLITVILLEDLSRGCHRNGIIEENNTGCVDDWRCYGGNHRHVPGG
jgi:hypothetical protein